MSDLDHARNLRRVVVGVCRDFELLQSLVSGAMLVVSKYDSLKVEATNTIQASMCQTILFNSIRAMRILEHAPGNIDVDRVLRKSILKELRPFLGVRDLNEHWQDPNGRKGELTVHFHTDLGIAVDEVSLVILGPENIMMGPLNLFDLYIRYRDFLNEIMRIDGAGEWKRIFH